MISDIDEYLVGQIEKITLNGEPIRVLLDYPEREHGKAVYPCVAIVRQAPKVCEDNQRAGCVVSTPSTESGSTVIDGDTFTGPLSWTEKPYPVPITANYEINVYATTKAHCDYLYEAIFKVIPPQSSVAIGDQNPYFVWHRVIPFGDTDLPIYGLIFVLEVQDLYVDRIESIEIPSVTSMDTEIQYDNI